MFSPSHDLLDCRQLYINTNHFCHADDDLAAPSFIDWPLLFCPHEIFTY